MERGLLKTSREDLVHAMEIGVISPMAWLAAFGRHWVQERRPGLHRALHQPQRPLRCAAAECRIGGSRGHHRSDPLRSPRAAAPPYPGQCDRADPARTRLTEDLPLFKHVRPDSLTPQQVVPLVLHLLSEAGAAVHGEVMGIAGNRLYAVYASRDHGCLRREWLRAVHPLSRWDQGLGRGDPNGRSAPGRTRYRRVKRQRRETPFTVATSMSRPTSNRSPRRHGHRLPTCGRRCEAGEEEARCAAGGAAPLPVLVSGFVR